MIWPRRAPEMGVTSAPSADFEAGYAAGLRDATAWMAQRVSGMQTRAHTLAAEAALFQGIARDFEQVLQARWAELDPRRVDAKPTPKPRRRKRPGKASVPAGAPPALDWSTPSEPAVETELSPEQEAERAVARAWRA